MSPLAFGTAGVRARVGDGPDELNERTVSAIAAGIASWVPRGSSVVVGHDARRGGAGFAAAVCHTLRGRGVTDVDAGRVPTPVLAFTTRHGDYAAGVMITASHNHREDNGIKVYDGSGAQLDDRQAAEVVAAAAAPRDPLPAADLALRRVDPERPYLDALPAVVAGPVRLAYTPLHGVGAAVFGKALQERGFDDLSVVGDQFVPDPEFPTVELPNPEEPGVLDHLRVLSASVRADLALAHDPDADRVALVVGSRTFTGDETGLLLADEVLRRTPGPVATTFVSSSALRRLAAARGVPYAETATGFKNLVRAHGGDLVYAYEEALGYACAPQVVRDKDGISAGLLLTAMAAAERARGRTLRERLADLERELGIEVATAQISVRTNDPGALLARPQRRLPTGFRVTREDPLTLSDGPRRIVARPSGTEPKLKIYLEAPHRAGLLTLRAQVADWFGLV